MSDINLAADYMDYFLLNEHPIHMLLLLLVGPVLYNSILYVNPSYLLSNPRNSLLLVITFICNVFINPFPYILLDVDVYYR